MTFRLSYQNRDGVWMEISPSNPVPVGVVGQVGQLDRICDDIIDRLNAGFDSLSTILREVAKGVSEPVEVKPVLVNVDTISEIVGGLHTAIGALPVDTQKELECDLLRIADDVVTSEIEFVKAINLEMFGLRKLLIIIFSVQTFAILSTIITLALLKP